MSLLNGLIKSVVINLFVFLFSSCLIVAPANAKSITGSFGAGTMIATPSDNIAIEDLQSGDRVISYNFKTHQGAFYQWIVNN